MSGSIERISLRESAAEGASQETIKLHLERYTFATKFSPGNHVLDIACGTGYGSNILATDGGAASVLGVDIDADAVTQAKTDYTSEKCHFLQSDYRDLDTAFESANFPIAPKFDMIISLETIEHLPDPDNFLKKLLPLLSPEGIFIGSVPVTPSMDANPYHLQDFSSASFRRLLTRNGLQPIENLSQIQKFNPITVKSEMDSGHRQGLRQNLGAYYLSHPNKLVSRLYSTVRFGFTNRYEVFISKRSTATGS